jgi:hypothetical protein
MSAHRHLYCSVFVALPMLAVCLVGEPAWSETPDAYSPDPRVMEQALGVRDQLGGSIVTQRGAQFVPEHSLQPIPAEHEHFVGEAEFSGPSDQVGALRETAWQLEILAQRLELQELGEQADALRTAAQELRIHARSLRKSRPIAEGEPLWGEPAPRPVD